MSTARPYSRPHKKADPIPDPQDKWFFSPDGTDIRVTHEDGSVAIVGAEPRTLPQKLHRAAAREGCSVQHTGPGGKAEARSAARAAQSRSKAKPSAEEIAADAHLRHAAISAIVEEALRSEETDEEYADAFTNGGKINVKWLSEKVGFTVEASERDEIQTTIEAKLDAEEGDGEEGDEGGEGGSAE